MSTIQEEDNNYSSRNHVEPRIRHFHWDPTSRKLHVTPEIYKWGPKSSTYNYMAMAAGITNDDADEKNQIKHKTKSPKIRKTKKARKVSNTGSSATAMDIPVECKIRAFHWDADSRKLHVTPEVYKWDLKPSTYRSMTKPGVWIWWDSTKKNVRSLHYKSVLKQKRESLKVKLRKATKVSSKKRILKKRKKSKPPTKKAEAKKPEKEAEAPITEEPEPEKKAEGPTVKPEKKSKASTAKKLGKEAGTQTTEEPRKEEVTKKSKYTDNKKWEKILIKYGGS